MTVKRFEDLKVWQKSQDLTVKIYHSFSNLKDYGFKDQITRVSVSYQIILPKGLNRNPMLYLSERLCYLDKGVSEELINETNEVSKMLYSFVKSMK